MTDLLDESHLTQGTTSPFLSGTKVQFAWDSTSIGAFKTCPRLYELTILEGWVPKSESVHLRFGIEYHHALETHARLRAEGLGHEDALRETIREVHSRIADFDPDRTTKTGKYKNRETLLGLIIDYLDHFVDDPCETYIKSDGRPAVELSFRFELDWGPSVIEETPHEQPYILCGHLDRVVDFNGSLFVMDHKTTTTTPGSYYFNQYEPNNQMTLYTLAGQTVLHSPIKGVIIRAGQILLTEPSRFVSGFTYRTPGQLEEWLLDLRCHLNNAEACAESDYWPTNDTACDKFGGCKFREVCSKDPEVRENFLRADFTQLPEDERWNPLRSR